MSAIALDQPWAHVRYALDAPIGTTYRDACGTRKAFDSGTIARVEALLDSAHGRRFADVNLQNTRFSFVFEQPHPQEIASVGFFCKEFSIFPLEKLEAVRRRDELAVVDESLERVAELARRTWISRTPGRSGAMGRHSRTEERRGSRVRS